MKENEQKRQTPTHACANSAKKTTTKTKNAGGAPMVKTTHTKMDFNNNREKKNAKKEMIKQQTEEITEALN